MKITDLDHDFITESRVDEFDMAGLASAAGGKIARTAGRVGTKIAAKAGFNRAKGKVAFDTAAKTLVQSYKQRLGKAGGAPQSGRTLLQYMQQLKFDPNLMYRSAS